MCGESVAGRRCRVDLCEGVFRCHPPMPRNDPLSILMPTQRAIWRAKRDRTDRVYEIY